MLFRSNGFAKATNAAKCRAATACDVGEETKEAPTASSDRTCRKCEVPNTFQDVAGEEECKPTTECGAGEEETTQPTTKTDRTCATCPTNTFGAGGLCQEHAICGPGSGVKDAGTALAQGTCGACKKKTYQWFQTGTCQPCVLGASFAQGKAATNCSWVAGITDINIAFEYTDGAAAKDVQDQFLKITGDDKHYVSVVKGGRVRRATSMTAIVSTKGYQKLVEASWMRKGGLDLVDENGVVTATFDRTSMVVTGPADDQPMKCTVKTEATLTSDRTCEEFTGDGNVQMLNDDGGDDDDDDDDDDDEPEPQCVDKDKQCPCTSGTA